MHTLTFLWCLHSPSISPTSDLRSPNSQPETFVSRVRQIKVEYAFEIVIGGTASIDPTVLCNIIRWFAAFKRNGQSLLVHTRTPPDEPDFLVISMADWAATANVLMNIKCFKDKLEEYHLRAPQLLFRLNTSCVWKTDLSAAITEATEHDSHARDADTKAHLTAIDSNVAAIARVADTQENQLATALSRIDTVILMARQALRNPANNEEKNEVLQELTTLKLEKKNIEQKITSLQGANSASIAGLAHTPPTSPPGITRPTSPKPNSPNPAKQRRLSSNKEDNVEVQNTINTGEDI
ncbi:hypothetical protein B0H17DRAFT_1200044 [Mycena rosella]|uniref:Uncharacterized protein n=1 Tax=Mycena rosella TaxID=1033263 RepID=A0AAD7DMS3_MYCRO|nr:hypothetical protein B0H17DRAFT_1200044 [Mycena rosella]